MPASRRRLIVLGVAVLAVVACGSEPAAVTSSTEAPITTTSTVATTTTTVPATTTTTTAPPSESAADLLVVGDWGSGTMPQGAVAGAMMRYAEEEDVQAILTTGDNFYSDDWEFLMEPFGWASDAGIPFWVSWGNHDIETETRIEAVNAAFDDPPRWAVHQWGLVDIVVLDSTQVDSAEQLAFLEETLDSTERPTIVVTHHPPYSCGVNDDSAEVIDDWLPVFDDDVVLVLSGHEHSYQRFDEAGVSYTVTGGGGAELTALTSCGDAHPARVAGDSLHHFVVLSQDGDVLNVSAVDVNGDVFDEFTVPLG